MNLAKIKELALKEASVFNPKEYWERIRPKVFKAGSIDIKFSSTLWAELFESWCDNNEVPAHRVNNDTVSVAISYLKLYHHEESR